MTLPQFGQWPSPVGCADLAEARLRLSEGFVRAATPYWLQADPLERGRTTLMAQDDAGTIVDLTPTWDLRAPIHSYGGTPVAVADTRCCFYDRKTQQVWVLNGDGEARAITAADGAIWAGFAFLDDHQVVAVREASADGGQPSDTLVVLDLDTDNPDGGRVIAVGADFYFSPVVTPSGWLAWMEYDLPSMPWETTRIIARSPDGVDHIVIDQPGVSAIMPQFAADDSLVFLSDQSGFWNFYRWADGQTRRLHDHPYDFASPPWVMSAPMYALLDEDPNQLRIGCSWWRDGLAHLGILDAEGQLHEGEVYGTVSVGPATAGRSIVGLGPVDAPFGLHSLDWQAGQLTPLAAESPGLLAPRAVARPQLIAWHAQADTEPVFAWFYPPCAEAGPSPDAESVGRPPLLVLAHGGPTGYAAASFTATTQFFTSRGIAVLDVNYSGSAGFGRAYRQRLTGQWGVLDVRDCLSAAQRVAAAGLVDPDRMAIMGGSAGGFTTLAALTTSSVFSAGISLYGIADLEALLPDSPKFESGYNQTLVGPHPQEQETYWRRSPVHHVDRLTAPLLILQGADDPIVPPNQATAMYEAVRAKGLAAELVIYEGEGHGFRLAATIEDAYRRILDFLGGVWGFSAQAEASGAAAEDLSRRP